jgi:hypothetical protein
MTRNKHTRINKSMTNIRNAINEILSIEKLYNVHDMCVNENCFIQRVDNIDCHFVDCAFCDMIEMMHEMLDCIQYDNE